MATLTLAWREGANALQNNLYLRVSFALPPESSNPVQNSWKIPRIVSTVE